MKRERRRSRCALRRSRRSAEAQTTAVELYYLDRVTSSKSEVRFFFDFAYAIDFLQSSLLVHLYMRTLIYYSIK